MNQIPTRCMQTFNGFTVLGLSKSLNGVACISPIASDFRMGAVEVLKHREYYGGCFPTFQFLREFKNRIHLLLLDANAEE